MTIEIEFIIEEDTAPDIALDCAFCEKVLVGGEKYFVLTPKIFPEGNVLSVCFGCMAELVSAFEKEVYEFVRESGGCSIQDVARRFAIHQGLTTFYLNRLENSGKITSERREETTPGGGLHSYLWFKVKEKIVNA